MIYTYHDPHFGIMQMPLGRKYHQIWELKDTLEDKDKGVGGEGERAAQSQDAQSQDAVTSLTRDNTMYNAAAAAA